MIEWFKEKLESKRSRAGSIFLHMKMKELEDRIKILEKDLTAVNNSVHYIDSREKDLCERVYNVEKHNPNIDRATDHMHDASWYNYVDPRFKPNLLLPVDRPTKKKIKQVRNAEIIKAYKKDKMSLKALSEAYGLHTSRIWQIVNGK